MQQPRDSRRIHQDHNNFSHKIQNSPHRVANATDPSRSGLFLNCCWSTYSLGLGIIVGGIPLLGLLGRVRDLPGRLPERLLCARLRHREGCRGRGCCGGLKGNCQGSSLWLMMRGQKFHFAQKDQFSCGLRRSPGATRCHRSKSNLCGWVGPMWLVRYSCRG